MKSQRHLGPVLSLLALTACQPPEVSVAGADSQRGATPTGIGGTNRDGAADAPLTGGSAARGDGAACSPDARRALGSPCGCAQECSSGFCADGVCCNGACDGPCVSCSLPERAGACTQVPVGAPDPHGLCIQEPVATCGRSGLCGANGCARYAPGTNCKPPFCSGNSLVYPYCHADGICGGGSPINCSPSLCEEGACKLRCTWEGDCAAGKKCVNGSCGLRDLGQTCDKPDQCLSGFCADGVCCDLPCTDRCRACGMLATRGRCTVVPADAPDPRAVAGIKDPAIACIDQGPGSCGMNGRCDGAGVCQRYAAGTVCQTQRCDSKANQWIPDGVCAGGVCTATAPRDCAPFRCDDAATRCAASCTDNDDCAAGSVCRDGSCGKKGLGSLCTLGTECTSGHCAQGVCCNTACGASCYACNLPRTLGLCTTLPEGAADPSGTCKNAGAASCGTDGTCDGAGGCRKFGPETVCAPQTCARGAKKTPSMCNGAGNCIAGTTVACEPFVCNAQGTDCFSSCQGTGAAAECLAPNLCNNQRCGPARKGQTCNATADCQTGLTCADGVCCATPCSGPCKSCSRTPGTCTDVPSGTKAGGCAVDATNACGNTGRCDGKGACAKAASTVTCAPATCMGASGGKSAALCDGSGVCRMPATFSCGNNRCQAGTCTKCMRNADCIDGKTCDTASGTCGPGSVDGTACTAGTECTSGHCVDGRCCEKDACGTCSRCGSNGKCAPVVSAPDPDTCPDEASSNPCGRAGCNAASLCPFAPATRQAAGPTCASPSLATLTTCDGQGGTTTTETACGDGFRCAAGVCPTSCTGDTHCIHPKTCVIAAGAMTGTCILKPLGAACSASEVCASGACAGSICCNDACNGPCQACSAAGTCETQSSCGTPDAAPPEVDAPPPEPDATVDEPDAGP